MALTSFTYAWFLLLVVGVYWVLPPRARPTLLLLASFAFYATWSRPALVVLAVTAVSSWAAGWYGSKLEPPGQRLATIAGVVVALAALGFFKVVAAFEVSDDPSLWLMEIAVPVGLSFFTLQAISYVVDVNRGEVEPQRSLLDVALYLSFFPHLLAGPIVRARFLIPSFHSTPRWPRRTQWAEAAELVLVGTFKKVVVADPMYAAYRSSLDGSTINNVVFLLSAMTAAYADVSGYIDIARGSAKFLGIDMQRNSLLPLRRTTGYADFWRRWQLTLMMWFRDYVNRPIRGGGDETWRAHAGLFATFAVLGIWHGLTFGWILWGLISGVVIVVESQLQARRAARRRAQRREARRRRSKALLPREPNHLARLVRTIGLVTILSPIAISTSPASLVDTYAQLLRIQSGFDSKLIGLAVLAFVAMWLVDRREVRREATVPRPDPVTAPRALAFGLMVTAIVIYSGPAPRSFVYFAF